MSQKKFGLDPGVRTYLFNVADLVAAAGEGGLENSETLVENALAEIAGQEVAVAMDSRAAPAFEKLVPLLRAPDVARVLRGLNTSPITVCAKGSGSKVVENLLARAEVDLTDEVFAEVSRMCDALAEESLADASCDANGTHVVRSLVQFCARGIVQQDPRRENLLYSFCAAIVAAMAGNLNEAATHKYAGPVLQVVCEALAANPPFFAAVVDRIFVAIDNAANFDAVSRHPVGSHLMETMLDFAPETTFSMMYTRWFRGHLIALGRDQLGNHTVQHLLSSKTCSPKIARLIIEELIPAVPEFFSRKDRVGIVMNMAECAAKHAICQTEICDALRRAVAAGANNKQQAPILSKKVKKQQRKMKEEQEVIEDLGPQGVPESVLKANEIVLEPEKEASSSEKFARGLLVSSSPSYLASRTAQALLNMPGGNAARVFGGSLSCLPPDFIERVCLDSSGSHIMEAFFVGRNVPGFAIKKMLESLTGKFVQLALSPVGSRVVEACYRKVDTKNKEMIAQELVKSEKELMRSRSGKFVLNTCKVQMYRERPAAWKKESDTAGKKRDAFSAALELGDKEEKVEEGKPTSFPAGSSEAKKYDNFLDTLGFSQAEKQDLSSALKGDDAEDEEKSDDMAMPAKKKKKAARSSD